MKSSLIRANFIDFFQSKGHEWVPPSPVVPKDDPTLLFTNAGMNQFKPIFLGTTSPKYARATNAQPCIRVSGKHNDLEDVGHDTHHHTSFEMLGNWSFGDYYKKEAIEWAWTLLTDVLGFPKQQLVVTVYETDDETRQCWMDVTDISPDRVVACGKADNFWEMGATGPCGPCSEIHLDTRPNDGGTIVLNDTGGLPSRYMELWNLVFIQYDHREDGTYVPLPNCHVDTGAGLERLAASLQGVSSNYDTDCFSLIIQAVADALQLPYSNGPQGTPHRVIADHVRTVVFGISDNVRPANDGPGYVLRRLIRRAWRFASQSGKTAPFMHQLVPVINESLGGHYPNIQARMDYISTLIESEESKFLHTVSSGLRLFESVVADLKSNNKTQIPGDTAFKLYDTYGFPLDLTQVMAKDHQFSVDESGFNEALAIQKHRSRQSRSNAISNGMDDSISVISHTIGPVQKGIYTDHPGGGEARIPANDAQRFGLAQHHTATHLLHEALRRVIGDEVQQAGSMVDINRFRFDFTCDRPIQPDEMARIHAHISTWIRDAHNVVIEEQSLDEAKSRGAHAMFGETYGDVVRVVDIPGISLELCGGNHVVNTRDLEDVVIVSSTNVSAGTRRIEAVVGHQRVAQYNDAQIQKTYNAYKKQWEKINLLAQSIKMDIPDLLSQTASLADIHAAVADLKSRANSLETAKRQQDNTQVNDRLDSVLRTAIPLSQAEGTCVCTVVSEISNGAVLRDLADRVLQSIGSGVVILAMIDGASGHAIAKVSPSLIPQFKATTMVNQLSDVAGGGGGGRDTMAQAGGLDSQRVSKAMETLRQYYGTTART